VVAIYVSALTRKLGREALSPFWIVDFFAVLRKLLRQLLRELFLLASKATAKKEGSY
jgi:hypothetical protein